MTAAVDSTGPGGGVDEEPQCLQYGGLFSLRRRSLNIIETITIYIPNPFSVMLLPVEQIIIEHISPSSLSLSFSAESMIKIAHLHKYREAYRAHPNLQISPLGRHLLSFARWTEARLLGPQRDPPPQRNRSY